MFVEQPLAKPEGHLKIADVGTCSHYILCPWFDCGKLILFLITQYSGGEIKIPKLDTRRSSMRLSKFVKIYFLLSEKCDLALLTKSSRGVSELDKLSA